MAKRERRDSKLIVLITAQEKREIRTEAARRGVSLAQVVRDKLFGAPR